MRWIQHCLTCYPCAETSHASAARPLRPARCRDSSTASRRSPSPHWRPSSARPKAVQCPEKTSKTSKPCFDPERLHALTQQPAHKAPAWLRSASAVQHAVAAHKEDDPTGSRAYLKKEWSPSDMLAAKRLGMTLDVHHVDTQRTVATLDQVRTLLTLLCCSS